MKLTHSICNEVTPQSAAPRNPLVIDEDRHFVLSAHLCAHNMHMASRFANQNEAAALGARIVSARKELRISQRALAEKARVERSLISKIESGRAKTYNTSVQRICTYLRIDASSRALQIATIQQRLEAISVHAPRVLEAIRLVLDVIEVDLTKSACLERPRGSEDDIDPAEKQEAP